LGWSFVPSKTGTIIYPGEAHHRISTNSDGFRDSEFSSMDSSKKRIFVIGDSFTSNIAVGLESVFTEKLENRLLGYDVRNFGVNGYSPVQEFLLLDALLRRHERPDLAIVLLYMRNDFDENMAKYWFYPRPVAQFSEDGEDLEIVMLGGGESDLNSPNEFPEPPTRSHLYSLFINVYRSFETRALDGYSSSIHTPPEFYLAAKDPSAETLRKIDVMRALMVEFQNLCDSMDVPLVFVLAPSILQADSEYWQYVFDAKGIDKGSHDRNLPNQYLIDHAFENGMLLLDLLPALSAEYDAGRDTYNSIESHWNAWGNEVVADEIFRFLEKERLIEY
jgi:hypothetical protein